MPKASLSGTSRAISYCITLYSCWSIKKTPTKEANLSFVYQQKSMNWNLATMSLIAILSSLTARRVTAFVPGSLKRMGQRFQCIQRQVQRQPASYHHLTRRFLSATVEAVEAEVVEELPTNDNDNELLKIRHSSAHVMAMAVQDIYPEAQVTIGPWIDNGFYYDFYFPETKDPETGETIPERKLSEQDLKEVKKAMDKIIGKDYPITREEVTREEARKRIEAINEPFKLEILDTIKTDPITIYHIGDEWWDLCAGPHVDSTGKLPKKAIALQSVAGAYWRGDENREMLQRVYATAWKDPSQLKQYKKMMEEAKKRDHRILGKKLDLFSIQVSLLYHCYILFCVNSERRSCRPLHRLLTLLC